MSNERPILYHYERSPYAEKVRLLFGLLDAEWRSANVPIQPPRPTLAILAGGYRRIPVMQAGADIYCDTQLICQELSASAPHLMGPTSPAVADLANRAESDVFFSAIRQVPVLKAMIGLFSQMGLRGGLSFISDRSELTKGYEAAAKTAKQAKAIFDSYVRDLDDHLADNTWLTGTSPHLADLQCYHPLFLALGFQATSLKRLPPNVVSWIGRIQAIGHGQSSEISDGEALQEAKDADPQILAAGMTEHDYVGDWVTIQPTDYGRVPVTGVLVGADNTRWVLARRSEDAGLTHLHFPKQGFECRGID